MTALRASLLGTLLVATVAGVLLLTLPAHAEENSAATSTASSVGAASKAPGMRVGQGGLQELIEKHRKMLAEFKAKKGNGQNNGSQGKRAMDWGVRSLQHVDASCMQKAVDVREVALQNAHSKSASAIDAALKTRQKALYDAWGNASTTNTTSAIRTAWQVWQKAHKDAFKVLRTERDAAWKTFRETARTSCKVTVPKEEEVAKDSTGSVAL